MQIFQKVGWVHKHEYEMHESYPDGKYNVATQ